MSLVNKVLLLSMGLSAFAAMANITIPEGTDPLAALLNLIMNWSSVAPLVKASMVVVIAVQLFKKFFPGFKYIKVVVVVGGVIYAMLQSLLSGMTLLNAAVFVLLTSGGAVALYELFKNPLNALMNTTKHE